MFYNKIKKRKKKEREKKRNKYVMINDTYCVTIVRKGHRSDGAVGVGGGGRRRKKKVGRGL